MGVSYVGCTTPCGRTARWGTGRRKNLPRPMAVEKTVASPPWKTLRVSHFPPAATAALFRPLQWSQKPWELRYDWTKNGGQVIRATFFVDF
jgi:hypothetical protein